MKAILVLAIFGLVGLVYAGIGPTDTRCGWTTALEVGNGALSMDWTGDVWVEPDAYSSTSAKFSRKWQGAFTFQDAFILGENWAYCDGQTQYDGYCGNFLTYIAPYWYQLGSGAVPSINYNCYYGYNGYGGFGNVEVVTNERFLDSRLPNSNKYAVSMENGALTFKRSSTSLKLVKSEGELTGLHTTESLEGNPIIAYSIDNAPVNIVHCLDETCTSATHVKTNIAHDGELSVIPGDNLKIQTSNELHTFSTAHGSEAELQCTSESAGTILPINKLVHACSGSSAHPSYSRLYEWKSLASPLHTVL